MNIDELKLVIDLVKTLSGDATSAFIFWMVFDLIKLLFICTTPVVVIWLIAKLIASTDEWAQAAKQIARAGGGAGGGFMYHSDRKAIDNAMKKD